MPIPAPRPYDPVGKQLVDCVRARELKAELTELSRRLGGGRDWGRFTSPEAILAEPMA